MTNQEFLEFIEKNKITSANKETLINFISLLKYYNQKQELESKAGQNLNDILNQYIVITDKTKMHYAKNESGFIMPVKTVIVEVNVPNVINHQLKKWAKKANKELTKSEKEKEKYELKLAKARKRQEKGIEKLKADQLSETFEQTIRRK